MLLEDLQVVLVAKSITGSLFDKDGAGGRFSNTRYICSTQNYGGRVGFERSDEAGRY